MSQLDRSQFFEDRTRLLRRTAESKSSTAIVWMWGLGLFLLLGWTVGTIIRYRMN